ncbi:MAG: C39 family peptidase [Roseburia sp.]|nr:C39 family peptidase [Roseburia sp.]
MTGRTKQYNRMSGINAASLGRQKCNKGYVKKKKKRRSVLSMALSLILIGLWGLFGLSGGLFSEKVTEGAEEALPDIPRELKELLEKNEETYDFVMEYPNREQYLDKDISLAGDTGISDALASGTVPLLMQWDTRWGYAAYGEEMVGLAGCGPACLCMAYLYLTEDLSLTPASMAEFAYEQGFYTEYGTDWSLWTRGVELLGMEGEELPLDEREIRNTLDDGGVVICSMRPGDFTTTGHFILLRDYDENGFYVNDPNRKSNSDRQWKFDELSGQIKNLWGIRG